MASEKENVGDVGDFGDDDLSQRVETNLKANKENSSEEEQLQDGSKDKLDDIADDADDEDEENVTKSSAPSVPEFSEARPDEASPLMDAADDFVDSETGDATKLKSSRLFQIPSSRVKTIMKLDPDVTLASQEAVLLISKATELFVETLAREALVFTQQTKKKTIQRKDLDAAVDNLASFAFLEGTLDT